MWKRRDNYIEGIDGAINPSLFFSYKTAARKRQNGTMPKNDEWLSRRSVCSLGCYDLVNCALFWSDTGIELNFSIDTLFRDPCHPKYWLGDAIELFIDTRNRKDLSLMTKYCHHIIIYPKIIEGYRFLILNKDLDNTNPSIQNSIECHLTSKKQSSFFRIVIQKEVLFGFEPSQFPYFGFAYKVHLRSYPEQRIHESHLNSSDYNIEKCPDAWMSVKLVG